MSAFDQQEHVPAFGRERPLVYEWVGEYVYLGYSGSPEYDIERPTAITKASPEARHGLFLLTEVSALGVVVRRMKGNDDALGLSTFMPWSAIQSVQGLPKDEEEREQFGVDD